MEEAADDMPSRHSCTGMFMPWPSGTTHTMTMVGSASEPTG